MAWKEEEEAVWSSKNPTSCLRTDFKYSTLMRDVCLSAVLVQHIPSARRMDPFINRIYSFSSKI